MERSADSCAYGERHDYAVQVPDHPTPRMMPSRRLLLTRGGESRPSSLIENAERTEVHEGRLGISFSGLHTTSRARLLQQIRTEKVHWPYPKMRFIFADELLASIPGVAIEKTRGPLHYSLWVPVDYESSVVPLLTERMSEIVECEALLASV